MPGPGHHPNLIDPTKGAHVNATADSGKQDTTKAAGNTAVPDAAHGDHDRVAMLSLNPDGTPDQTAGVEIIGDKSFAQAATREQFQQQAVSAADQVRAQSLPMMGVVEDAPQDPSIQAVQDEHAKIADAAIKAADDTVGALFAEDAPKPQAGAVTPTKDTESK